MTIDLEDITEDWNHFYHHNHTPKQMINHLYEKHNNMEKAGDVKPATKPA